MASVLTADFHQVQVVCELDQGIWYKTRLKSGSPADVAVFHSPDAKIEARLKAVGRAKHPNLPELREVLPLENGSLAAVFAAATGPTVAERIKKGNGTVAEAIDWACRVGEAIAVLHDAEIIHGDIEPGWVRLVPGRGPMLTGLVLNRCGARMRGYGPDLAQTLRYTPPEQLEGELTAKCDIYSVGAVLFHALTGRAPFDGAEADPTDADALRQRIMNGKTAPLAELRPDLRGVMAYAVDRSLQTDPARRFPNAEAFRKALRSALVVAPMMGRRPLSGPPGEAEELSLDSLLDDDAAASARSLPPPVPPVAKQPRPKTSATLAGGHASPPAEHAVMPFESDPPARNPVSGGPSVYELDVPDSEPIATPADELGAGIQVSPSRVVSDRWGPLLDEKTTARGAPGVRVPTLAHASVDQTAGPANDAPAREPNVELSGAPDGTTSEVADPPPARSLAPGQQKRETSSWTPPAPSADRDAGGPPVGVVGSGPPIREKPSRERTLRMVFGDRGKDAEALSDEATKPSRDSRGGDAAPDGDKPSAISTRPFPIVETNANEERAKASPGPLAVSIADALATTDDEAHIPLVDLSAPIEPSDTDVVTMGPDFLPSRSLSATRADNAAVGPTPVAAPPSAPMRPAPTRASPSAKKAAPAPNRSVARDLYPRDVEMEPVSVPTIRVMRQRGAPQSVRVVIGAAIFIAGVVVGKFLMPGPAATERSPYLEPQAGATLGDVPQSEVPSAEVATADWRYPPQASDFGAIPADNAEPDPADVLDLPAEEDPEPPLTLTLEGLPERAEILVDGQVVYGVTVPLDGETHRIEVRAEGYLPWTREVTDSSGDALRVELTPEPSEVAAQVTTQPRRSAAEKARSTRRRQRNRAPFLSDDAQRRRIEARLGAQVAAHRANQPGAPTMVERPTVLRDPGF